MDFLFIVQGEGRGHMTQAIAFSKLLENNGHQLVGVILGKSKRRAVPEFFERKMNAPIHLVKSPNFETDRNQKKVSIHKTILKNVLKLNTYQKSLKSIDKIVHSQNPDVILNFYDLLGGLYNFIFRPKAQFWVIGHQYLIGHPSFKFAPNRPLDKFLFQLNTAMTSLGADERLALSFLPQIQYANQKVRVVPPLLRPEVKLLNPKQLDFYLAYMVNPGYSKEVIHFAKANPTLQIKVYWDKKEAAETELPLPNLSFHRIHDQKFLQYMANCKGLVCTAGFESICEAKYLGKPVMMIPVAGQYEQACNALDAVASGVGIASADFDFAKLDKMQKRISPESDQYIKWADSWQTVFRKLVSEVSVTDQESERAYPQDSIPAMG
jgi:uncharacterized protein (TIGR00661 family)